MIRTMPTLQDAVIDSHGVRLRPLTEADVPLIAEACADPASQYWLPILRPYTLDSAREFALELAPHSHASGDGIERGVEVDGEFVGVVGLKKTDWRVGRTEAGYWVAPWARGRGIAAKALCAITDWALDTQGMRRVEIHVATGNAASLATAERAMFTREGTLRHANVIDGEPVDMVLFSRLTADPRPA